MKTQWQTYKDLELIPQSVGEPQTHTNSFIDKLGRAWRSLSDTLVGKQPYERELDHLERCLALDFASRRQVEPGAWHQFWASVNQHLDNWDFHTMPEPRIWQSTDREGQTWWHVHDPQTGDRIDLESEEDVCVWIEQSFYR
jgi:hypothetical protein